MPKPALSFPDSAAALPATIRYWMLLAVATLAVSGIAPLVLLAGRGSMLAETETIKTLFHNALVIHVDLSVLAWFLAIALLFWALITHHRPSPIPTLRGAALACFGAGGLCIGLAPLLSDGAAVMSNYIPVHTSALFFFGLSLLLAAVALGLIDVISSAKSTANPALCFAVLGSAYIIALAIIHFCWAYARLESAAIPKGTQDYYELLFWAGGHILQFAVTQLLLVAWLWLADAGRLEAKIKPALLLALFSIYPLIATASPLAFMDDSTPYNLLFFTQQMRHGGGIAAILLGLYLLHRFLRRGPAVGSQLARLCLLTSIIVFASGGVIGYLIGESSTVIPAHYHGSIVGCTVAFMGVIYLLLPKLGYADVATWKSARWQPLLYGGGSLMHAVGFAIAGGHGAARKTVGAMEGISASAEAAMGFARLGGTLAVIGGALFIIVAIRAVRRGSSTALIS